MNDLSKLYRAARQEFDDIGSYVEFQTKLQNPESRQKLYNAFREAGYDDLGAYSAFEQKLVPFLTYGPQKPSANVLETGIEAAKPEPSLMDKVGNVLEAFKSSPAGQRFTGFLKTTVPLSKLAPSSKQIQASPYKDFQVGALPDFPGDFPVERKQTVGQTAAVARSLAEQAEGLTSVENAAILVAMGGATKPVQALGSAGFAALMASSFPEQWQAFKEAETEEEKIRIALNLGGSALMTAAAAVHGAKGGTEAILGPKPKPTPAFDAEAIRRRREELQREDAARYVDKAKAKIDEEIALKQRVAGGERQMEELRQAEREGQARGEEIRAKVRPVEEAKKTREFGVQRGIQEEYRREGVRKGDLMVEATPKNVYESITNEPFEADVRTEFIQWRKERGSPYLLGDLEIFARERMSGGAKPPEAPAEVSPIEPPSEPPAPPAERPLSIKERQQKLKEERLKLQEERLEEQRKRFEEKRKGKKPVAQPTPEAERVSEVPRIPEEKIEQSVKLMLTKADEKALTDLGYSAEQINKFKPEEAAKIIEQKVKPSPEVEKQAEPVTIPTPLQETGSALPKSLADFQKQYGERPSAQHKRAVTDAQEIITKFETDKVPVAEWSEKLRTELKSRGYADKVVDEVAAPRRERRPSEPESPSFATSRAGRTTRTVEPETPELKRAVDEIATAARKNQDAQAIYEQARQEIFAEIEKLGGKVFFDDRTNSYKLSVETGKTKLLPEDLEAINKLRQEAAEGGGYSIKTVGQGFDIVATPSVEGISRPLPKASLKERVANLILRKRLKEKTEAEFNNAKKKYKDSLIDRVLTEEEPTALLGRAQDGAPVEIVTRRALSQFDPDIEPFAGRVAELKGKAFERAQQAGSIGDAYIGVRKVSESLAKKDPNTFFRKNLSEADVIDFENVLNRAAERYVRNIKEKGANARIDAGLLDAGLWRDMSEIGYYTFKALGRAGGRKAVEFGEWSVKMLSEFGEAIRPYLKNIWDEIQKGYKGGDIALPSTLREQFVSREVIRDRKQVSERLQSAFGYSKKEADIQATILDAMAENWERNTGRSRQEYYETRFADITKGGQPAEGALLQTRQITNTPEFKKWFGNSKVVDENGEPLVVYHGTGRGGFSEFEKQNTAYGYFFTPDREAADYYTYGSKPQTYEVFLKITKPLRLDKIAEFEEPIPNKLKEWIKDEFDGNNEEFVEWLQSGDLYERNVGKVQNSLMREAKGLGYDGVVFHDAKGGGGTSPSYVVFEPTQIKSAIGNRGTFDPTSSNILYQEQNRLGFYTKLQDAVEKKIRQPMRAEDLQKTLENAGIRKDEIAAFGLDEFIKENAGKKITKEQLQQFVDENSVKLEEAGGVETLPFKQLSDDAWIVENPKNPDKPFAIITKTKEGRYSLTRGDLGELVVTTATLNDAKRHAYDFIPRELKKSVFEPQFESYQLPGAKEGSYREMFVTALNQKPVVTEIPTYELTAKSTKTGRIIKKFVTEDELREMETRLRREGIEYSLDKNKKGELKRVEQVGWKDGHEQYADIENPVVRVRFNERVDTDGKRTLFIEEIQKPSTAEEAKMPAHFRNNAYEIGIKRIIRYAAENGYDRIGWTEGRVQADRYDLSKQVDSINGYNYGDNKYKIKAIKDNNVVIEKEIRGESELSATVGKDLAKKIASQPSDGLMFNYAAGDLKVGGEGLARVYDEIIPAVVNKIVKKWGEKAGKSEIKIDEIKRLKESFKDFVYNNYTPKEATEILGTPGREINENLREKALVEFSKKEGNVVSFDIKESIHSLDINSQMKREVLEQGFSLFQGRRGSVEFLEDGRAVIRALENPNLSTALHEFAHVGRRSLYRMLDETLPEKKAQLEKDIKTLETWAQVKEGKWTKAQEELYARAFERYLREGKAPRPELNSVFARIKEWMTQIYRNITGSEIDVKLTDEIRDIFGRQLGAERATVEFKSAQPYGINSILSPTPEGVVAGAKLTSKIIEAAKNPVYKYAVQPLIKTVEQGSETGKKAASGFRSAIDRWERNENSNFARIIVPIAKVLGRNQRLSRNLDTINADANIKEAGFMQLAEWAKAGKIPEGVQVNPIERQAFDAYIKLAKQRKEISDRLKKADTSQGELFGDYNTDLFIKTPTPELLESIKIGHGQIYDKTIDALAKLNPSLTREQVKYNLDNFRFNKFNEFPTHIKHQGSWYPILASDALSALQGLNRDISRLKGLIDTFGKDYKKSLKDIREGIPTEKQGDFDNMVNSYFGIRPEPKDPSGLGKRWAKGLLEPIVKNAMLANAAIMQPTQYLSAYHMVGPKAFYGSLLKFLQHPLRTRAELEAVAAYNRGFLDVTIRRGRLPEDLGKALTEVTGKITLLEPLIKATDIAITNAFKAFADGIKNRGGKLSVSEKQTLRMLDFTEGQINVIDKGGLARSEELYSSIIRRGRKATTFTELKGPEKSKFQHSALGQVLLPFQNFSIGQLQATARVTNNVIDSFKKNEGQVAAINKMATFLVGTALVGETSLFLRAYFQDRDIKEALLRGDEDIKERITRDFIEAGIYPYRLIDYSLQRANNGYEFVSGLFAATSIVADGLDAFFYKRGRYKDKTDLEAAGMFLERYTAKPYVDSTIHRGIKALATTIGLVDDNPKIEIAIRRAYKWKGTKGYDTATDDQFAADMRRALRSVTDELKKADVGEVPFNDEIRESIVKAIHSKVLSKTMKKDIGDLDEAASRVASSLRSRRVLSGLSQKEVDELSKAIGGQEMLDQLVWYDRLLESLADSVNP